MTTPYPLAWPEGFPRSKQHVASRFKTSLAGALRNVRDSLRLFAADSGQKLEDLVISSNVTLGSERPSDPGVAVWFRWAGMLVCIPVDRYAKPEENLQAIHHVLEARRVEIRHAGIEITKASFRGFTALPPPSTPDRPKPWHEVLGCRPDATKDEIARAYRAAAKKAHPDHGGSDDLMAAVNAARDEGMRR